MAIKNPVVYVDTVACKELEFVLTLRLVINTSIYVDTVACKELEFMSTLWLVKHPGVCIHSGL